MRGFETMSMARRNGWGTVSPPPYKSVGIRVDTSWPHGQSLSISYVPVVHESSPLYYNLSKYNEYQG